jgi:hypothetical protein
MSDTTDGTTEAVSETSADTSTEETTESEVVEGAEALGDAGKKALDAMKAKWKGEAEARKALEAQFNEFKAKAEGKEAEYAAAQQEQRVKAEALAAANRRILTAEVKAAAKGVLTDPTDALTFLDLDALEVSDEGDVDADSLKAALDNLVRTKPYLAVQDGRRFQGGADAGTRKETAPDIDQQIAEASKAGNHALAISLKRQKAHASQT